MVLRLKLLIVKSLLSAMVLKQKFARIGYDLENKSSKIRIDGNSSVNEIDSHVKGEVIPFGDRILVQLENTDLSNSEKIAVLSGGSK